MSPLKSKVPISAVLLTYNEEINIEKCLMSLCGWCEEIIVVDSFSNDKTIEIAKTYTNKIFQNTYEGHPQQWKWALKALKFTNPWILAMDADFVISDKLKQAIEREIPNSGSEVAGYYVRHRQVFKGRSIRFGGIYPKYWLRIFRADRVRVDEHELVDVHFYVDGKTGVLPYDVIEDNLKDRDIIFWVDKQKKFALCQAEEELKRRRGNLQWPVKPSLSGTPDQRTLWFKTWWFRMPLYLRPFLYFIFRYFFQLGFLDGKEGFLYHFTQGFWYRFLVDAKLDEMINERWGGQVLREGKKK